MISKCRKYYLQCTEVQGTADTWRLYNVVSSSMQRHDVETLYRRQVPAGEMFYVVLWKYMAVQNEQVKARRPCNHHVICFYCILTCVSFKSKVLWKRWYRTVITFSMKFSRAFKTFRWCLCCSQYLFVGVLLIMLYFVSICWTSICMYFSNGYLGRLYMYCVTATILV